jgi:4'-phosphopantetheinyl transferase
MRSWLIALHDTAGSTWDDAACRADLSPEEERRSGRFRRAAAAVTYIRARSAVRGVLGHVLDEPPSHVRITAAPGGGPVLPDHPEVCVSWSTTAGVLLVAVGRQARIGVDVEVMRPIGSPARVLRIFYPDVHALGEFGEPETFFSAWTLLEAAVKATGRGLARGAREVRLHRPPGSDRCALVGIRDVDEVVWSGRTDRFTVPGSSAEVMTAIVVGGVTGGTAVPVRPQAWRRPDLALNGRS